MADVSFIFLGWDTLREPHGRLQRPLWGMLFFPGCIKLTDPTLATPTPPDPPGLTGVSGIPPDGNEAAQTSGCLLAGARRTPRKICDRNMQRESKMSLRVNLAWA